MVYNVFVRNWWKKHPKYPGRLEPDAAAEKKYLAHGLATEKEAQDMAQKYNASHDPGRLSRKAEYESEQEEHNGYPNYATWNVNLWVDGTCNQQKRDLIRLDKAITAKAVVMFVHRHLDGTTPDLNAREMKSVDYVDLARRWEDERLTEIEYLNA